MSAPNDYLIQLVPAPQPHCQQIVGIVGAVSWRRGIRNGTFHYYLFRVATVGTENVTYPKPVSFALCPVDRSHRLSKLQFAIHPPAQFLSSVLVNNSDLIFITAVELHLVSPQRQDGYGFPRGSPQRLKPRPLAWHSRVPGSSTPGEVKCDATAPPCKGLPRISVFASWPTSVGLLSLDVK